jgi:hypothetical protein
MLDYLYETMVSCDMMLLITLVTSYVPIFIILFKNMEENMETSIRIEKNMFKRIQELEAENAELKAKLAPLDKEIDDEKLSIQKPLGDDEEDDEEEDESEYEGDDEGDDEGDKEKRTNNLTESLSEELNFGRI